MSMFLKSYKTYFTDKKFIVSFLVAIFFLAISLVIQFYAGTYATESASSPVTDIVLSNIQTFDLDGIFVYGSLALLLFGIFITIWRPKQMPFVVKSVAMFILVRSFFISLTHIGPFPTQIIIHSDWLSKLTFGGDLFFSGHTGLPFLLALIFWHNKIVRNIFLSFSIFFAAVVLMAHMHYTIDVVSAYFITYTIFHICERLFKKDRLLFFTENTDDLINTKLIAMVTSISPFR